MNSIDVNNLYKQLLEREAAGKVARQVENNLELFTYSRDCQLNKDWDDITLMARGLVIDRKRWKVAVKPFPKFFNYGEMSLKIPDEPFVNYTKYDGSLGLIFFDEEQNQWRCITKGSFQSEQAVWATEFLRKNINTELLNKNYTYCTEIIVPWNRIVIKYDKEALVLLSSYNNETCEEDISVLNDDFCLATGFEKCQTFECYSFRNLVDLTQTLPASEEGWVVRFRNGYRVKIKGEQYLALHRIVSDLTPARVWELVRDCEDIKKYKEVVPEEFHNEIDQTVNDVTANFTECYRRVVGMYQTTLNMTDKETAAYMDNIRFPYFGCVFSARKKNWLVNVLNKGDERYSFFKLFKPKAKQFEKKRIDEE